MCTQREEANVQDFGRGSVLYNGALVPPIPPGAFNTSSDLNESLRNGPKTTPTTGVTPGASGYTNNTPNWTYRVDPISGERTNQQTGATSPSSWSTATDTGSLAKIAGSAGPGGASQIDYGTSLPSNTSTPNPWYDFNLKDASTGASAGSALGPVGALAGGIIYGLFGEEIKGAVEGKKATGTQATGTAATDTGSLAKIAGSAGPGGASQIDYGTSLPSNTSTVIPINYSFGPSVGGGGGNIMPQPIGTSSSTTSTTKKPSPAKKKDDEGRIISPDVRQRVSRRSMFYTGPNYERSDVYIPTLIGV